jgi:hypothetical protein
MVAVERQAESPLSLFVCHDHLRPGYLLLYLLLF